MSIIYYFVETVGLYFFYLCIILQNIIQYKYRIKTSKNNKKKKPTVPDRRTDKTREYKHEYTKSSKLHVI